MKKKLVTILLSLVMTLSLCISAFAADDSLIENLPQVDTVKVEIGIDRIKLDKTVSTEVDRDASLIVYRINVDKDTNIKIDYKFQSLVFAIGVAPYDTTQSDLINSGDLEDIVSWVDVINNATNATKNGTVDLKLKKGSNAIAVLSTRGTYDITAKATGKLKTMSPFTVNSVYATSTYVSGKGVAGATVKVIDAANFKTYETTVKSDNTFKVKIDKQEKDSELLVTIKKDGYIPKVKDVVVKNRKFTTFTVNTIKSKSTYVTGKGKSGATVTAYVGSKKIGSSTVKSNGTYSIKIAKQSAGKKVKVSIRKAGYDTKSKTVTVKK